MSELEMIATLEGCGLLNTIHSFCTSWPPPSVTSKCGGLNLDGPPLLATFHPVTLEYENTELQVAELLAALDASEMPVIITRPNADTRGRVVAQMLADYSEKHPRIQMVDNLGTRNYFSLMACAAAMVGNSSSGIIEAPSFGLPVVNIGTRQAGRVRGNNVLETGHEKSEILKSIKKACSSEMRASLVGSSNPYGDGHAADIIVSRLAGISLDDSLIRKVLVDGSGLSALAV